MQFHKTILFPLAIPGCQWALAFGGASLIALSAVGQSGISREAGPSAFGNLPLYFEANRGQTGGIQSFVARGRGCNFLIAPKEALLTLARCDATQSVPQPGRGNASRPRLAQTRTLRLEFAGANPDARISGIGELPGKVNYFIGNNPALWRTGLPLFTQVRVDKIYAGVDLVYYCNQQRLEYDFVVAPRADPRAISMRVTGADGLRVDAQGDLVFSLGNDEIRQPKPLIYQTVAGTRKAIAGGYRPMDEHTVSFWIGNYDRELPLVIDPILSYSTFLGGSGADSGWDIGLDTNGFVYVTGSTMSANLQVTTGAYDAHYSGGTAFGGDVFVAKLNNQGSQLEYLTYLGGKGDDAAYGLSVDSAGNAYLTGSTSSPDFPFLNGVSNRISGAPYPSSSVYPQDAFVTEIDPSGSNLIFSTYLGGTDTDIGLGIAVDTSGFIYVTGVTYSSNFPAIGGIQTNSYHGGSDAFVTKLTPSGSGFVYSTYLGGNSSENGEGIVADAVGSAYLTGFTYSTNFPITTNALQVYLNNPGVDATNHILGSSDAFLTTLNSNGDAVVYSTFLGGVLNEIGFRIALDPRTNLFIAGSSQSTNFPMFPASNTNLQQGVSSSNFLSDVFVTKFGGAGTNLIYSAMFGGTGIDQAWDLAVDSGGNAHVVGESYSTDFPTVDTFGRLRAFNSGGADAFVAVLNSDGTALVRSAYLGGSGSDFGNGIEVDAAGNDYIVGATYSTNFPTTLGTVQPTFGGTNDAFIAKILVTPTLAETISGENVVLSWPAFSSEFRLQSTTDLSSDSDWSLVVASPVVIGGRETVTLGATNDAEFFRLHTP
jgi:hypothetical protein